MIIYSLPMEFVESLLQSRIGGIGILVFACTMNELVINFDALRYLIVATSEVVANFDGPARVNGSLATTRLALLRVKIKTLLKPPSVFW